jgi:hypothetical protein
MKRHLSIIFTLVILSSPVFSQGTEIEILDKKTAEVNYENAIWFFLHLARENPGLITYSNVLTKRNPFEIYQLMPELYRGNKISYKFNVLNNKLYSNKSITSKDQYKEDAIEELQETIKEDIKKTLDYLSKEGYKLTDVEADLKAFAKHHNIDYLKKSTNTIKSSESNIDLMNIFYRAAPFMYDPTGKALDKIIDVSVLSPTEIKHYYQGMYGNADKKSNHKFFMGNHLYYYKKFGEKKLQLILGTVTPKIENLKSLNKGFISLEKTNKLASVFERGHVGRDCGTATIPLVTLAEGVTMYKIRTNAAYDLQSPVAYVLVAEVTVKGDKKKLPYIITINGFLNESQVVEVSKMIATLYGTSEVLFPKNAEKFEIVNFKTILNAIAKLSKDSKVVSTEFNDNYKAILKYHKNRPLKNFPGLTTNYLSPGILHHAYRVNLGSDLPILFVDKVNTKFNGHSISGYSIKNRALTAALFQLQYGKNAKIKKNVSIKEYFNITEAQLSASLKLIGAVYNYETIRRRQRVNRAGDLIQYFDRTFSNQMYYSDVQEIEKELGINIFELEKLLDPYLFGETILNVSDEIKTKDILQLLENTKDKLQNEITINKNYIAEKGYGDMIADLDKRILDLQKIITSETNKNKKNNKSKTSNNVKPNKTSSSSNYSNCKKIQREIQKVILPPK